jgi:Phospholipase_D-nuclease N-terminal
MRFILGLIYIGLIVWCLYDLFTSKRSFEQKILWAILVVLFPVAGPVIYYLLSRKIIQF